MSKTDFANKDLKDRVEDLEELSSINVTLLMPSSMELMRNDSRKIGKVVTIRVQIHVTQAVTENQTFLIAPSVSHPGYGIADFGDTNTGVEYECMVTENADHQLRLDIKNNIPIGYYALTYTYILLS